MCHSEIFEIQRQRIVKEDRGGEKKTYCIQDDKNTNDN